MIHYFLSSIFSGYSLVILFILVLTSIYFFVGFGTVFMKIKNIYQYLLSHYIFSYYLTLLLLLLLLISFLFVMWIGFQSMGGGGGVGENIIFWSYLILSPVIYALFSFMFWNENQKKLISLAPLNFLVILSIIIFIIITNL